MDGYPIATQLLIKIDDWLAVLAKKLPAPDRKSVRDSFMWRFPIEDARVVAIAKLVRAVSGLHAAVLLAEAGFVTEVGVLLRVVSDLAMEAVSVCESHLTGEPTTEQKRFVDLFFRPYPETEEERIEQANVRYVNRAEHLKADLRMAKQLGFDGEQLRLLRRSLNAGYDSYVHGSYASAMELYDGEARGFMLQGHRSAAHVESVRKAIAGKVHEVVYTVGVAADAFEVQQVFDEAKQAVLDLDRSGEYS